LIAVCEYVNFWGVQRDISIFIKNPLPRGHPPSINELDIEMIFVFSFLGVSSTFSLIITICYVRRNKTIAGINQKRNELDKSTQIYIGVCTNKCHHSD